RGYSWSRKDNRSTAQFYRVTVDNSFPYRVYGGQQDNTSVRIASQEFNSGGIGFRSWDASAGGESAFLAFDPDNPRYVLGGSYLGTIEVLDTEAKTGTNVMAAPIQYLGLPAREMRYLYNWNAPIIWSQHEPNTYYHAAQYLLRTRDMGKTWEEVSPDLTRNQDQYQGNGGGPYTNEAVGAENYGTISYVVESPHESGVIWTGSDDGLVHLTIDGAKTWKNVTPKGLQECLINAIEVSPHDPATAYIATTRYKFHDHTPALYVTKDYGKTWKNISSGIPDGAFTRVIREDEDRKGLLYAGTETGLYASWDGGEQWQSLQLNLPVTPITDLIVRHGDLVIATGGRGFWILDDLKLLANYQPAANELMAYQPEDAMLLGGYSPLNGNTANFDGMAPFQGVNPASGVVAYYHLPNDKDSSTLTLDILNAKGDIVRTYSSTPETFEPWAGGPSSPGALPTQTGLNRFVWDLRHEPLRGVPGVYIEGSYRGHKVPPGQYTLRFHRGDASAETTVMVKPNPNVELSETDYATYDAFLTRMAKDLNEMHDLVNSIDKTVKQIERVLDDLPESDTNAGLREQAEALLRKLKAWDATMVQRKAKAYDDVENYVNGFTADVLFVKNHAENDQPVLTAPSQERYAELDSVWQQQEQAARVLLNQEVESLNQALMKRGIGAIRVQRNDGAR
ncbi:MAG: glycosyl hydrolase, partial [Bacteroidota bacterium]